MIRKQFAHSYDDIISCENLLLGWREFLHGKRKKKDVQDFSYHLSDNIVSLYADLRDKTYRHGEYYAFNISDPKPRSIHKASVRDRLLHHTIYRILYPFFDDTFVADSFSCRVGKGTHKALNRFRRFGRQVSRNHTRTCWVLKCDVRKFFASIDHKVLMDILNRYIPDRDIQWLISGIVDSFFSTAPGKGLPLGNLTSQLLVNIYMNEFDQFVKHKLKARYYIRYADDFVILSENRRWLEELLVVVRTYLKDVLKLDLHPDKVSIATFSSGVDFLGWVHFPHCRILRTATKHKMMRNLAIHPSSESIASYKGMLSHGNSHSLLTEIDSLVQGLDSNVSDTQ